MKEIFQRRSVRKFKPTPLSQETIDQLLKAAMRAPSAGNQQPWEFVVLTDRDVILKIPTFHPHAAMLEQAPCAIVVCGNQERLKFDNDYWVQDCSAATQNLLLEAVHLGLGTVWVGVYPVAEFGKGLRELLELPDHIIPLNIIPVGYPAEIPKPIDTYRAERVHSQGWGKTQ